MNHSLHYLFMANHAMLQKKLFASIKDLNLSIGQPKVLDFLRENNGAMQKEIARGCYIEPASLSTILNGMEKNGLIIRQVSESNRRNSNIYMTEKGKELSEQIAIRFRQIEETAFSEFTDSETDCLMAYLTKIYENLENSL